MLLRPWFEFASQRVPKLQSGTADEGSATAQKDPGGRGFSIEDNGEVAQEGRQHPKVFYRREPEATPFIVAKP